MTTIEELRARYPGASDEALRKALDIINAPILPLRVRWMLDDLSRALTAEDFEPERLEKWKREVIRGLEKTGG